MQDSNKAFLFSFLPGVEDSSTLSDDLLPAPGVGAMLASCTISSEDFVPSDSNSPSLTVADFSRVEVELFSSTWLTSLFFSKLSGRLFLMPRFSFPSALAFLGGKFCSYKKITGCQQKI